MKYIIILTSILLFSCSNTSTDTITLIPKGYVGPVKISLCDGKGKEEKLENGKRVYEVDINGLLTTKFKAEFGWQFNKYYYVNESKREEIRFINIHEENIEFDKDSIYVFAEQHSGIGSRTDSTGTYQTCPIISFYVGKYDDIEKKMHEINMFSFNKDELLNE
ncbi:hypothetical protein [uncultured Algibacter sp.]|uniref:DUF6843 domain-containing protein n=1 Tax=uncultured Algibacter sp. TaxID=298659 RepID=UPI00263153BF|nr:hypothetical protein [uncultured Algibacter sp.]